MKRIAVVTGRRADYGRLFFIMKFLESSPDIDMKVIAAGPHLSERHGMTVREVEKDFRVDHRLDMKIGEGTLISMTKSLALGLSGFADIFSEMKPDIVLVLGDTDEMLAAAVSASHMNIPVAHIGGGHISGSIDDRIRDAITVFSDLHFVATEGGAKRVVSIGAEPSSVHIVGAPDLDAIRRKEFTGKEGVAKMFDIDLSKPLLLVSMHPVTTEAGHSKGHMENLMSAVRKSGIRAIAVYPNSDAGSADMIEVLEKGRSPQIQVHKNIPYPQYLGLMSVASAVVGNSSAGIIEAPSFGLPAVNIGSRQQGRERAENVIDVGYGKEEILSGIKKAVSDRRFIEASRSCKNPYGDGKASERIVKILREY